MQKRAVLRPALSMVSGTKTVATNSAQQNTSTPVTPTRLQQIIKHNSTAVRQSEPGPNINKPKKAPTQKASTMTQKVNQAGPSPEFQKTSHPSGRNEPTDTFPRRAKKDISNSATLVNRQSPLPKSPVSTKPSASVKIESTKDDKADSAKRELDPKKSIMFEGSKRAPVSRTKPSTANNKVSPSSQQKKATPIKSTRPRSKPPANKHKKTAALRDASDKTQSVLYDTVPSTQETLKSLPDSAKSGGPKPGVEGKETAAPTTTDLHPAENPDVVALAPAEVQNIASETQENEVVAEEQSPVVATQTALLPILTPRNYIKPEVGSNDPVLAAPHATEPQNTASENLPPRISIDIGQIVIEPAKAAPVQNRTAPTRRFARNHTIPFNSIGRN